MLWPYFRTGDSIALIHLLSVLVIAPLCVLQWWDRELERGFLLYRAKALHDAYTTHQQAIAFPVPAYLKARMRTGLALPRVEVEARQGEGTGGEGAGNGEAPGEKDAILEWAVEELNTELFTEMVHYFPAPRD